MTESSSHYEDEGRGFTFLVHAPLVPNIISHCAVPCEPLRHCFCFLMGRKGGVFAVNNDNTQFKGSVFKRHGQ